MIGQTKPKSSSKTIDINTQIVEELLSKVQEKMYEKIIRQL